MSGEAIVNLSSAEAMRAATVGIGRHLRCRRDGVGNADRSAYKAEDWGVNVEGAGAECAFAKWLGVYWDPPTALDDGTDVAGVQVKSSTFDGAHLIIPARQGLDTPVVLVTGQLPEYVIRGWYRPDQVDEKWLRDQPRPAYWVPQGSLYLLDELRVWMRAQAA